MRDSYPRDLSPAALSRLLDAQPHSARFMRKFSIRSGYDASDVYRSAILESVLVAIGTFATGLAHLEIWEPHRLTTRAIDGAARLHLRTLAISIFYPPIDRPQDGLLLTRLLDGPTRTSLSCLRTHEPACGHSSSWALDALHDRTLPALRVWSFACSTRTQTVVWPQLNNGFIMHAPRLSKLIAEGPILGHIARIPSLAERIQHITIDEIRSTEFRPAVCVDLGRYKALQFVELKPADPAKFFQIDASYLRTLPNRLSSLQVVFEATGDALHGLLVHDNEWETRQLGKLIVQAPLRPLTALRWPVSAPLWLQELCERRAVVLEWGERGGLYDFLDP